MASVAAACSGGEPARPIAKPGELVVALKQTKAYERYGDLAFGTDDALYVADYDQSGVRVYPPRGAERQIPAKDAFSPDGGGMASSPLAVAPDGTVYVARRRVVTGVIVIPSKGKPRVILDGPDDPGVSRARQETAGEVGIDAVAVDPRSGVLYVATGRKIFRVAPSGRAEPFAGTGEDFSGDGRPAAESGLGHVEAMAVDPRTGVLWVAGMGGRMILRVEPSGILTQVAGTGQGGHSPEGVSAKEAALDARDIALDPAGRLVFLEWGEDGPVAINDRVRRIEPASTITTILDTGEHLKSDPEQEGCPVNGAVRGQKFGVSDFATDSKGNIFLVSPCKGTRSVVMVGAPTA
jgi:sugar lactone lactonase YvrE